MKIENMLQRFSCNSFLFKPSCMNVTYIKKSLIEDVHQLVMNILVIIIK